MKRRQFIAGGLGLAATGAASQDVGVHAFPSEKTVKDRQSDDATIHPWRSDIMTGFPPLPQNQVTRENHEESQEKLRWAMQHWRELFPTQRVSRGASPIAVLGRQRRNIMHRQFEDSAGKETTFGKQARALSLDALIVVHEGTIVCEDYFHGMRPETPHIMYSMNKSIVASVVATLLGEGLLRENTAIEECVPELQDTTYAGATIRQIFDMESGVLYRYAGDNPELAEHERAISPAAKELAVPVSEYNFIPSLKAEDGRGHGEGMRYKESDPSVLVWAAEKVTGKRFADLLSERIWSKLGAEFDLDAVCDSLGHWTYHLSCSLRDVARWGLMCLNLGHFNGQQIVPKEFFDDIHSNARVDRLAKSNVGYLFPDGTGYRSFFYHQKASGGVLAAIGAYGQFCYMSPKHDVVIAMFSSTQPWGAQLAAGIPYDTIFEQDRKREKERWQLCHAIAESLG